MGSTKTLILVIACLIFFQGCETVKGGVRGAKEGAQKDWQAVKNLDKELEGNMW